MTDPYADSLDEIRVLRARLAELERIAKPPINRSQLRDPAFVAANREALKAALAAGEIVDDQLTRDDVKKLKPGEINAAMEAGRLAQVLNPNRAPVRPLMTLDDVRGMSAAEVADRQVEIDLLLEMAKGAER